MKQKMLAVAAMVAVLMSGMTALASNPSATGSLVQVRTETYEGKEVVGYIVAADGSIIEGIELTGDSWIKVTDLSEASTVLSAESQEKLDKAIEKLDTIASLTDIIDVNEIPETFDIENAVALSVFDLGVSDEILAILEANPGALVSVNVYAEVEADVSVIALHNYADDLWEILEASNNGDGSVAISIGANGFSPVAIYVDTAVASADAEDVETETVEIEADTDATLLLVVAGIALVGAIAVTVVLLKKRKVNKA